MSKNGPRVEIWGRSERRPTNRLGAEEIGHPLIIRPKIHVQIRENGCPNWDSTYSRIVISRRGAS
jgi:hypothetical protein